MTTTQQAGWLPAQVQALANLIVREELSFVPLVEAYLEETISLRRMGDDAELGVIAMGNYWIDDGGELGRDVILYLDDPSNPGLDTIRIVGAPRIIAAFHRYVMTGSLYPQE